MELEFTFVLGSTLFCLLLTFLILLKGTRNFVYRTTGLVCFVFLVFSISYGYMNLIGKPKPLTYETWPSKTESEDSKGEGEEGAGQNALTMDILKWENNPKKQEAYLWMREENQNEEKPEYYSFSTNTEDGKELLKQLKRANREAMRRGLKGQRNRTGIKLRIRTDKLLMAPKDRFKFFTPPAKMLPPKPDVPPGIRYPINSDARDQSRRDVTPRTVHPSVAQPRFPPGAAWPGGSGGLPAPSQFGDR